MRFVGGVFGMIGVLGLVGVVACYQPAIPAGIRCSPAGECPGGQACIGGVCEGGIDAAIDDGELPIDDAPIDAALGPWSPPELLTALSSTSDDTDPELSGDGLELFFATRRTGDYEIFRATRASALDPFGAPALVPELSSALAEFSPALADGGLTIYFDRDGELYRASRVDRASPFGTPVIDGALSSADADTDPAISADGRVAIVVRPGGNGSAELYQHDRASPSDPWSSARHLAELGSTAVEGGPWLDATGRTILFHSTRDGGRDVFVATRASPAAAFSPPVPVPELSSPTRSERDPTVSADGRTMVLAIDDDLHLTTR